jgi:hypothetical protein
MCEKTKQVEQRRALATAILDEGLVLGEGSNAVSMFVEV